MDFPTASHLEHRASLWRAILHAPGFAPSFPQWWNDRHASGALGFTCPVWPPSHEVALAVFEFVETCTRVLEKHLNKHRAYHTKLRRGCGMRQVYATVKRDPPQPVDSLWKTCEAKVSAVDHDDVAVEL